MTSARSWLHPSAPTNTVNTSNKHDNDNNQNTKLKTTQQHKNNNSSSNAAAAAAKHQRNTNEISPHQSATAHPSDPLPTGNGRERAAPKVDAQKQLPKPREHFFINFTYLPNYFSKFRSSQRKCRQTNIATILVKSALIKWG